MDGRDTRLIDAIADIAAEEWRFRGVFTRAIASLEANEQGKYVSRYSWFRKKVETAIEKAGLRIVSLEGRPFDVGMAVMPLNIDDFEQDDCLYVEQMVEPIIMKDDAILREGSVILGRVQK